MWCDTEKLNADPLLFTHSSDSGITSPQSHINIDVSNQVISTSFDNNKLIHLFQLFDHLPHEELSRRLSIIYKSPNLDEDEKQCLHQVLNLIQNLDSLTIGSILNEESINLEIVSIFCNITDGINTISCLKSQF